MSEDFVYKEMILDLYRHPLNKKTVQNASYVQRGLNPSCGDDITLQIRFDAQGSVVDVGFQGDGCAISIAALSLLTDEMFGKTRAQLRDIHKDDILSLLGIPISHTRLKCALLGWQTLQNMLHQ